MQYVESLIRLESIQMPLEATGGGVQLASSLPQERIKKKNAIPINRDLTNFT